MMVIGEGEVGRGGVREGRTGASEEEEQGGGGRVGTGWEGRQEQGWEDGQDIATE